jgi:glyceraldehyde-3-phosphate dehydrogenase (NAD(P))
VKLRVGVNGFGTIGKRVADAVVRQPDLELVGVAKTRPGFEARRAVERGYPLYVAGAGAPEKFTAVGLPVAGRLADLLGNVDVIVDATPEDVGRENRPLYESAGVRAVYQGGEEADVAEGSFNALANYDAGKGKRSLRVVSCNTTALARAASVLLPRWGVEHWEATLVRRAAEPGDSKRGPVDGIVPTLDMPSHHGPDVRTVLPQLSIATAAVVVPTTLMHVHVNYVRLGRAPADAAEVVEAFRSTPRFRLFAPWEGIEGTPQVMEFARDLSSRDGRAPSDMPENVLWERGVRVEGRDAYFFQAVHQESIVVPENIDAIRAMFDLADGPTSIATTDRALGLVRPGALAKPVVGGTASPARSRARLPKASPRAT